MWLLILVMQELVQRRCYMAVDTSDGGVGTEMVLHAVDTCDTGVGTEMVLHGC